MILRFITFLDPRLAERRYFLSLLAFSFVFGVSSLCAQTDRPSPTPQFSQSGNRKRIVFDYSAPDATPTPTPTPSATPSSFKVEPPPSLSEATPSPFPSSATHPVKSEPAPVQSTPQPTPPPEPSPTPVPVIAATPTLAPVIASTPTPTPAPVVAPVIAATPTPAPVIASTPTPTPAPVVAPVIVAAPSPTPTVPEPEVVHVPTAAVAQATPVSTPTPAPQPAVAQTAPPEKPASIDVVAAAEQADLAPLPQDGSRPLPPSQSVTINLINKLVQRGILTKEDAADMIRQAEAEAQVAREEVQADMVAIAQATAMQATADQMAINAASAGTPSSPDDVSVTYIPEPVKLQIKEDIKSELIAENRAGHFNIGPKSRMPEWVARIRPFADIRFRYEGDFFPQGNDATGAFPNFNAINTGQPFDVTGNEFAPQFNVDQNRNRFRIRLRMGAEMDVTDDVIFGVRLATGENNSPVTANQTVGLANQGQGGNFSKYAIWLDRAFIRYDIGKDPDKSLSLLVGRFDNPFFSTNLIWDDELGFDGIAAQARYEVFDGITPFVVGGAFPVFNTDFNFSSNQPTKFQSYDKYLFGGQIGIDMKIAKDWNVKLATSYYYFYNIEGELSSPYTPLSQDDAGDTDNSRPSFAQKGNTYFPIRNIVPDASNDFGTINQWQYYGLATKFQELALTGRIDYNGFEPVQVSLIGEFVQNLAFDKSAIDAIAVNNRGANDDDLSNSIGAFDGSPQAWMVDLRVGTPALAKAWDWSLGLGYRWIGSDAVVDGFNDSDFGLGGTNMKGFTIGGALALSPNVWAGIRWMGSDSIAGPTFKVNIIQLDLHTKF